TAKPCREIQDPAITSRVSASKCASSAFFPLVADKERASPASLSRVLAHAMRLRRTLSRMTPEVGGKRPTHVFHAVAKGGLRGSRRANLIALLHFITNERKGPWLRSRGRICF